MAWIAVPRPSSLAALIFKFTGKGSYLLIAVSEPRMRMRLRNPQAYNCCPKQELSLQTYYYFLKYYNNSLSSSTMTISMFVAPVTNFELVDGYVVATFILVMQNVNKFAYVSYHVQNIIMYVIPTYR